MTFLKSQISFWALPALTFLSLAAHGAKLGEENVQVRIPKGSLVCHDKVPNHGFGAMPGSLAVEGPLIERSLRVSAADELVLKLPDSVSCADLRADLDALPLDFVARRSVLPFTWEIGVRSISVLRAKVAITLPFKIAGHTAQLEGGREWVVGNVATADGIAPTIPYSESYTVSAHPQSASKGHGLFCDGRQLSMGYLAGYDGVQSHSNVEVGVARFATAAECETTRSELLSNLAAADPGNDGTLIKVKRVLVETYRYIPNNAGDGTCQLVQLDTAQTHLRGTAFTGTQVFPLHEVALELCLTP